MLRASRDRCFRFRFALLASLIMTNTHEDSPLIPPVTIQRTQRAINESYNYGTDSIRPVFKTYKRRWYILGVYTTVALMCNVDWNTWGPISEACKIIFGWQNWQVLLITSWAASSLILSALPATWMIDKKGLRSSVILCTFLLTAGKALQVIPCSDPLTRTILLNAGQCVAMLSCPIALGGPSSVSATWFPPNERTTATAVLTLLGYAGVSASFIIGPYMVPLTESKSSLTNGSITYDKKTMNSDLTRYIGVKLGISVLLLVVVLVHFPDKPPLPPCATSIKQQYDYGESLKKLICDGSYLYLGLIFAMSYGVFGGWISVLSLAIKPFGIDDNLSGWLGCAAVAAGILSGICLARVVDYVKRHTKTVLIVLFFCTTISQLIFTLTCSKIIPFSKPLLFSSIILGGLFFNATTPLLFEMAVETVYPIAEGLTVVFILVIANCVYLLIVIAFMFPWMHVEWMNWATVVSTGLCVPGLSLNKPRFRRLDLDSFLN